MHFFWQVSGEGLLDSVYALMYVVDLMFPFPTEQDFDLVQRVMDCMEVFGLVSSLRMNPDKISSFRSFTNTLRRRVPVILLQSFTLGY